MVQHRPNYDPLAAAEQSYQVLARAFEEAGIETAPGLEPWRAPALRTASVSADQTSYSGLRRPGEVLLADARGSDVAADHAPSGVPTA